MTPSEAHDSAWQREPGHDEMTIACREYIEEKMLTLNWPTSKYQAPVVSKPHKLHGTWCEHFFTEGGRWFADILGKWVCEIPEGRRQNRTHSVYGVFEIKPKIHSAGALLRQLAVQKDRLEAWAGKIHNNNYSDEFSCFVEAIVLSDDPLIDTLLKLGRGKIWIWDAKQGVLNRDSYAHRAFDYAQEKQAKVGT